LIDRHRIGYQDIEGLIWLDKLATKFRPLEMV
jgi:hypothetical protein